MKTLILGIGNPILTDDGVGIKVANEIRTRIYADNQRLSASSEIDVREASLSGISLLDDIVGYDRLIIVDSIKTEKATPGRLYELKLEYIATSRSPSYSHGVNLRTAIELGRRLGYKIPEDIDIYAIEIEDNTTFSEECTERVKQSIPKIVDKIIKRL